MTEGSKGSSVVGRVELAAELSVPPVWSAEPADAGMDSLDDAQVTVSGELGNAEVVRPRETPKKLPADKDRRSVRVELSQ